MKKHRNLWPAITDFSNLLMASQQAQKGKRFRDNVLEFNFHLESELFRLQAELKAKTYTPGAYNTFYIFEPKPRMISAAPYRDRVIHHALCNVVAPIFERTLIIDSYANRVGYGSHRALRRFTEFARSSRYILQADIYRYFPSIDHEILKTIIRRKIECRDTLWLIDRIIDCSNPQESVINHFPGDDLLSPLTRRRGLPIGNLISQFMSNWYLNNFDHFIKETLKVKKYVRYVDDFALFADDHTFLKDARLSIEEYLASLRLKIHPVKSQLFKTKYGANFVGFRILPDRIRVRSDSLRRGRIRLRRKLADYHQGKINGQQLAQSTQSWLAHLDHANTWRLKQKIFQSPRLSELFRTPSINFGF